MNSTAGLLRRTESAEPVAVDRHLRVLLCCSLFIVFGLLSLFLVWRRLAGALTQPLPSAALLASAVMLIAIAAALRAMARGWFEESLPLVPTNQREHILFAAPGVFAALVLISIATMGGLAWGAALGWLAFIAAEGASWFVYLRPTAVRHLIQGSRPAFAPIPVPVETGEELEEPELPPGLVQQLTRVREDERESVHALIAVQLPAGDRLAVEHIAFCPPLAAKPELTAHAIDNDAAVVSITTAEAYGARVEVRLPAVAQEPRQVLIEVIGSVNCRESA